MPELSRTILSHRCEYFTVEASSDSSRIDESPTRYKAYCWCGPWNPHGPCPPLADKRSSGTVHSHRWVPPRATGLSVATISPETDAPVMSVETLYMMDATMGLLKCTLRRMHAHHGTVHVRYIHLYTTQILLYRCRDRAPVVHHAARDMAGHFCSWAAPVKIAAVARAVVLMALATSPR